MYGREDEHCVTVQISEMCFVVDMLHPIREIAHFMNWPNFCPLHELASTLAYFHELGETY
jgi:hypothetical protein